MHQVSSRGWLVATDAAVGSPVVSIMGVDFDGLTESRVVDHIGAALDAGRGGWVVTPNTDIVRLANEDPSILQLVARADLVVPDGMPVVWASRIAGDRLPERVTGSSLIWSLTEAANASGRSVFLLGGNPGVAERAAAVMEARYPNLKRVGHHFPPFGFEKEASHEAEIVSALERVQPDIVFCGLGFPRQEKLINRLAPQFPNTWFMGCGASLSFVAGEVSRAPGWMQTSGLEWVHRLAQEPSRLARRYLLSDFPFASRLIAWAVRSRLDLAGK